MEFVMTILAMVIVFALIAILYIVLYNKLQNNLIRINESENEIDETLRKRYDLLVKMESLINNNTKLDQNNFKDFNSETKISNFDADRKLTKITETFKKIRSDYSKELDIEAFNNILTELKINEEKNEAAKAYYNKFTTKLNLIIKKFPSNIIARIHKIKERNYFDNKNLYDDDILDFKL